MKAGDRALCYVLAILAAGCVLTGLVLHHANISKRWNSERENTKVSCGGGVTYEFDWRIKPGSIICPRDRYPY